MKTYFLNTACIGLDIIDLVTRHVNIMGVIGLSDRAADDAISDYVYQYDYCTARKLEFIEVDSYGLSSEVDREKLLALEIDVLIVVGWQRLVPKWLIEHCSVCVIGAHGSPLGITKGRGRSPQNWALLLGLGAFYISIFTIDEGIDSGNVIYTKKFEYSTYDDIKTSYYKVSLLIANMIIESLKDPDFSTKSFIPQDHSDAGYLPQRTPQDGAVDWHRSNEQIRQFVCALTRPYPGAESVIAGRPMRIWSLIPFDIDIPNEYRIGEIVKIFNKGDILVRTKESFVLIDDYEFVSGAVELAEGMVFESACFAQQMTAIIERHEQKYPHLPIASILKIYQ